MTKILEPDPQGVAEAATLLQAKGLVAFPTETVYGLGADARDGHAVARIYEAKGRPSFNPLIAHVASVEMAHQFVQWSDMAETLAAAFWPGPLTLVLPLKFNSTVSSLVTAGLSSLAIRVPDHPLAQQLLTQFGGPIAAPSANPSGRLSPTNPAHVMAGLEGRIEAVLDGGECAVGLESTIIGLTETTPQLLRPGGVPTGVIEQALGQSLIVSHTASTPSAPGQLSSHYAPNTPIRLNAEQARQGEAMLGFGKTAGDLNLSQAADLHEAAANLFSMLHKLDRMSAKGIAVAPIPQTGLGQAINDRLTRAAAPRSQ